MFSENLWLLYESKNIYLCHVTKLTMSLAHFKRQKYFYAFDQCFRQFLDKALQITRKYVLELSLSFPQLKTELKNYYWFVHPLQRVKAKWNSDFRFGGKSARASNKASHAASKSLLFSFVLDIFQAISVIFLTVWAHEEEYQTSGFVGEENL